MSKAVRPVAISDFFKQGITKLKARKCARFQIIEKCNAPKIAEGPRCEVHKTQLLRFAIFLHPLRVLGARRRRNTFTCNFGFVTAENEPAKNVLSGEQLWEKS